MAQAEEVIREVLALLAPMVEPDGGSMTVADYSAADSRLRINYATGVNEACSTCVLDAESLKAFIDEGLRTRGVELSEITVVDSTPRTSPAAPTALSLGATR